jgi:serine/threonine protein phosphatase 1
LCQLHETLVQKIRPKDRVIYLGNYLGPHSLWTGEGLAVIDELISFRNALIGTSGFFADDAVFLHGQGEDLLQQILRLTFHKNPARWLEAALAYGLECYAAPYGASADELVQMGKSGIIAINRWTHRLQEKMRDYPGHHAFFQHLKSAAISNFGLPQGDVGLMPAGLDPSSGFALQFEQFCWPQGDIGALPRLAPFTRLVRGQTPKPAKPDQNRFVLTLDDGMGVEGKLYAVCLDDKGRILEWLAF